MSEQTAAAIDAAIEAHVLDEQNMAFVSGYALIVAGQGVEDMESHNHKYWFGLQEGQSTFTTLGLSRMQSLYWDKYATLEDEEE